MSSIGNVTKWNVIDTIIYKTENIISRIASGIRESKDELPDPEEMILAATKELQEENDELKKLRIPEKLIKSEIGMMCPICHRVVEDVNENGIRFCSGCGQRIILPRPSPYSRINKENNLV